MPEPTSFVRVLGSFKPPEGLTRSRADTVRKQREEQVAEILEEIAPRWLEVLLDV